MKAKRIRLDFNGSNIISSVQ